MTLAGRVAVNGTDYLPATELVLPAPIVELVELVDFTAAAGTIGMLLPPSGYTGRGISTTLIRMRPFTSTKTAPTAKGTTNPLRLLRTAAGSSAKIAGFTLAGTPQGNPQHMYGGLMVASQSGAQISDILVRAIPGNAGGPPGETFGVADYKCDGATFTRVEVDGRDASGTMTKAPDGSARVGASGMACNSSRNIVWTDCYVHDHYYGMPTCWDTVGFVTRNFRSANNWRGINHERASGVIEHHNPQLLLSPVDSNRNALMHFSFNSDVADCPTISVFAPVWSGGAPQAHGALCVTIGANYAGWKQKQTSIPTFYNADGSLMTIAEAGTAGNPAMGVAAVPARNMDKALADPAHTVVIFR